MKIMIVGVGRLGSQIAYMVSMLKPEKTILVDIKDLSGDILDLQHSTKTLPIQFTTKKEIPDFLIISAGLARNKNNKSYEPLRKKNLPLIKKIVKNLDKYIDNNTVIIPMTNPVKEVTELISKLRPNNRIITAESELMRLRDHKELGWDIIKTKGYTNFGPALSVVLCIKKYLAES